jgi:hypothetical protein
MDDTAAVGTVDYTLRRSRQNAKLSPGKKRRGLLSIKRAMFGLPRSRGVDHEPQNKKTALKGRGIETIYNVSSRSRGCGSAATSVNVRGNHHERIDVYGRPKSQGFISLTALCIPICRTLSGNRADLALPRLKLCKSRL